MTEVSKKIDKKVKNVIENMARFLLSSEIKKNPRLLIKESDKCIAEAKSLSSRQRYGYMSYFKDIIADDLLFCNQQHAIFTKKYKDKIAEGRQKREAKVITNTTLGLLLKQAADYRDRANEFDNKKFLIEGLATQFENWFVEGNTKYIQDLTNEFIILEDLRNKTKYEREALNEVLGISDKELNSLAEELGFEMDENDEMSNLLKDDDYDEDFQ